MTNRAFYSEEAEKALIGAVIANGTMLHKVGFISDRDFWNDNYRRIFIACNTILMQKQQITMSLLDDVLSKSYERTQAQGALMAAIAAREDFLTTANVVRDAQTIREASLKRNLKEIGERMVNGASDTESDIAQILEDARSQLRKIATPNEGGRLIVEDMLEAYEYLEKLSKGEIQSLKTGIKPLDEETGGLFGGELTVIGARPAVGKSALGFQIAASCAKQGKHVWFVSLEMSGRQIALRKMANDSMVNGMKMRTADFTPDDWVLMWSAIEKNTETRIHVETGIRYVEDLRMKVQSQYDKGECDVLVVDYLQLLNVKRKYAGDTERVGAVSRALKQITIEFGIPVVALAQVNRKSAGGSSGRGESLTANRRPTMNELRSSGEIEQDADTVILLHVPEEDNDETVKEEHRGMVKSLSNAGAKYMVAIIEKQRQGQTGRVRFIFEPKYMRFREI